MSHWRSRQPATNLAPTTVLEPSLTAVLAELEEAVGGLAARQRDKRPSVDSGLQIGQLHTAGQGPAACYSPRSSPLLTTSKREPRRGELSVAGRDAVADRGDLGQPPAADCSLQSSQILSSDHEATCSEPPAVSHDAVADRGGHSRAADLREAQLDVGEIEASFAGSQLQSMIDSQIDALEDITNLVAPSAGGDGNSQKKADEAIGKPPTVRFLRHSRALPCRCCGRHFFPASLKFHEATCERRASEQVVECPRCSREVRRCDLDAHVAKCGKALQRVLELSQRLEEEADASAAGTHECIPSEHDFCARVARSSGALHVSSTASASTPTPTARRLVQHERSPLTPLKLVDAGGFDKADYEMTHAVARVALNEAAAGEKAAAGAASALWEHAPSAACDMAALELERPQVPRVTVLHRSQVRESTNAHQVPEPVEHKGSHGQELRRSVPGAASACGPLLQISSLRKKVSQLCQELGELPVAEDIMAY